MSNEEERKPDKHSQMSAARDSMNHNHAFLTLVDVGHDHQHILVGTTRPAMYTDGSHVHRIYARTSFSPKGEGPHWHLVDIVTCPSIDLPGGEHTHQFAGQTSYDLGHKHCFDSVTDTAPDTECDED